MKLKGVWSLLLALSLGTCFAAANGGAAAPVGPLRADLSRLVVVGDSLSAGFQNGATSAAQPVGCAALVAAQAGVPLPLSVVGPGDYVTQFGLTLTPGILANPAAGPLPNAGVLTAAEAAAVNARVLEFNAVIAGQAAARGAVLVDIHTLTDTLRDRGYVVGGQRLTTAFLGGIFSLDAVHPTNTGGAVIANEFIKALNRQAAAGIPPVNVRKVQREDPLVLPGFGHPRRRSGPSPAGTFAPMHSVLVQ